MEASGAGSGGNPTIGISGHSSDGLTSTGVHTYLPPCEPPAALATSDGVAQHGALFHKKRAASDASIVDQQERRLDRRRASSPLHVDMGKVMEGLGALNVASESDQPAAMDVVTTPTTATASTAPRAISAFMRAHPLYMASSKAHMLNGTDCYASATPGEGRFGVLPSTSASALRGSLAILAPYSDRRAANMPKGWVVLVERGPCVLQLVDKGVGKWKDHVTDKTLCVLVLRGLGTGDPADLWKELTSAWGLPLINKIDSIVTRTPASQSHLLPCLVTHPASDVGGAFEAMLLCLRAAHHQLTVEEMEAAVRTIGRRRVKATQRLTAASAYIESLGYSKMTGGMSGIYLMFAHNNEGRAGRLAVQLRTRNDYDSLQVIGTVDATAASGIETAFWLFVLLRPMLLKAYGGLDPVGAAAVGPYLEVTLQLPPEEGIHALSGRSVTLAALLAMVGALFNVTSKTLAATGDVELLTGRLISVGNIDLKLEGAVSRSVRDVLLPLDNSDDEGYITMPNLGAPANVVLFPEEAQQLRLSAMPTLDHALQYLLGPSPSADVPSPSVAAAVNDALVSHAALRGLNMDSFGFGATGVYLHTAEAAILQRKAPSEDALGLHSSGYGVGCLRACLDVMLSSLEGDQTEMVPLHKGQHRLLTNLTGAGLQATDTAPLSLVLASLLAAARLPSCPAMAAAATVLVDKTLLPLPVLITKALLSRLKDDGITALLVAEGQQLEMGDEDGVKVFKATCLIQAFTQVQTMAEPRGDEPVQKDPQTQEAMPSQSTQAAECTRTKMAERTPHKGQREAERTEDGPPPPINGGTPASSSSSSSQSPSHTRPAPPQTTEVGPCGSSQPAEAAQMNDKKDEARDGPPPPTNDSTPASSSSSSSSKGAPSSPPPSPAQTPEAVPPGSPDGQEESTATVTVEALLQVINDRRGHRRHPPNAPAKASSPNTYTGGAAEEKEGETLEPRSNNLDLDMKPEAQETTEKSKDKEKLSLTPPKRGTRSVVRVQDEAKHKRFEQIYEELADREENSFLIHKLKACDEHSHTALWIGIEEMHPNFIDENNLKPSTWRNAEYSVHVAVSTRRESATLWVVGFLVHKRLNNDLVYLEAYAAHPQFARRKVGTALLRVFFQGVEDVYAVKALVLPENKASKDCLTLNGRMFNRGFQHTSAENGYEVYEMKKQKQNRETGSKESSQRT